MTYIADEELIKYGWDEDVWFHVDNLSSAHIYVRLPEGETWDKISEPLLIDCAQLTKANSIEGKSMILSILPTEKKWTRGLQTRFELSYATLSTELMFHRQQEG